MWTPEATSETGSHTVFAGGFLISFLPIWRTLLFIICLLECPASSLKAKLFWVVEGCVHTVAAHSQHWIDPYWVGASGSSWQCRITALHSQWLSLIFPKVSQWQALKADFCKGERGWGVGPQGWSVLTTMAMAKEWQSLCPPWDSVSPLWNDTQSQSLISVSRAL